MTAIQEAVAAAPEIGAGPEPFPPVDGPALIRLPTRSTGVRPRRRLVPRSIERLGGVVLLFAAWQLASDRGWLRPEILAGPLDVVTTARDLVDDGSLGAALGASLGRVAWGLGLGLAIGTVLALVAGLSRLGDDLVDANVQMLRFVPIIGLQPLLISWLGIGEAAKIGLLTIGVAFPVYVNTSAAIRGIDPRFAELAGVVGLTRAQRVRRIVLPGALPGFFVGLRMATAVAWLLLVFAEQLNARSGLGFLIIQSQTFFRSDAIVVCLIAYALLGLTSDGVVRTLERRFLRWQPGR